MTTQLREDIGPEFDDLREPLTELQKLRGMTPRAALTKHLLDGDDSLLHRQLRPAGQSAPRQSRCGSSRLGHDGVDVVASRPHAGAARRSTTDAT